MFLSERQIGALGLEMSELRPELPLDLVEGFSEPISSSSSHERPSAHIAIFCTQISTIHRMLQPDIIARNKFPSERSLSAVKNVSPTDHLLRNSTRAQMPVPLLGLTLPLAAEPLGLGYQFHFKPGTERTGPENCSHSSASLIPTAWTRTSCSSTKPEVVPLELR